MERKQTVYLAIIADCNGAVMEVVRVRAISYRAARRAADEYLVGLNGYRVASVLRQAEVFDIT
jgi:hypothetical protein